MLFAVMPVTDLERAAAWYERLLGAPASFKVSDDEWVWDLAEGRSLLVERAPQDAGHGRALLFVQDLAAWVDAARSRGLEPRSHEQYDDGVHKANYADPDGNQVGLGGLSPHAAGGAA